MTNSNDDASRVASHEPSRPDPIARLQGDRGEGVISAAMAVCAIRPLSVTVPQLIDEHEPHVLRETLGPSRVGGAEAQEVPVHTEGRCAR